MTAINSFSYYFVSFLYTVPRDGVFMTLEGLKQEKYADLFEKKGITFDTLVNLTKDDLVYCGVTDEADLEAIVQGVAPLKHLFREVSDMKPPDTEAILANNLLHLNTLAGSLILIRKKLQFNTPQNTLIDVKHTAGSAVIQLLEKIPDELTNLLEDIVSEGAPQQKRSMISKRWMFGFLATIGLVSFVVFKYKKC